MNSEIMWASHHKDIEAIRSVEVSNYSDWTPLVAWDSKYTSVQRVLLRPKTIGVFMAAMFWVDALLERGAEVPELILPYAPGARQDRLNSSGDYLFTAKSIAKEINSRGFPGVTIIDPHSDVISSLIDRCAVVKASECVQSNDREWQAVISPDGGAEKRASGVAHSLGLPMLHGWKSRDVTTGRLSGFGVEPIPSGVLRCLVVDDICDGGGTFIGLAEELERVGVQADLYVTHGLFSKGIAPLLAHFNRVIYTDSILGSDAVLDDRVQVIPICKRLLMEDM